MFISPDDGHIVVRNM